ncbi:MAG: hypothetical protein LAN62_06630 [Acidobacteriia bacterium]|jgi:hypothetical protein|nr:hypothetical protein [Terriglobia bacterium]
MGTAIEPRLSELREDFAVRKIPTTSLAPNLPFLEIIFRAYSLITTFQQNRLQPSWQNLTLAKLRYRLFLLPRGL